MKRRKPYKRVSIVDGEYKITFWPVKTGVLENVKLLDGRQYRNKAWYAPITKANNKLLKGLGFTMVKEIKKSPKQVKYPITEISGFGKKLYKFQNHGVSYLEKYRGRGMIADEMGLGKTVQSAAWLHKNKNKLPVIIICPATGKLNWKRELLDCLGPSKICILEGRKPKVVPNYDYYIINYDILSYWVNHLMALYPRVLITDECQYYKNSTAKRTKAVKKLAKQIPHFIALSGTPIENQPSEIYNAINIINSSIFPNQWAFMQRYCGAIHNGFGWDFSGATHMSELYEILITSGLMIRRKKKDVLKQLPDKTYSYVPFKLKNSSTYHQAEKNFLSFIQYTKGQEAAERASQAETLTKMEALKQVAVDGKIDDTIEWIKDFLNSGEKLVVFAIHKTVIERLMKEFKKVAVKIDGSVSGAARQTAVDEFQNNPDIKLFVGNIKAAGVLITLTASSNVAFIELPLNPALINQAEDRVHRIGQKNSVNVWYLLAEETIEYKLAKILDKKRKILSNILDGENPDWNVLITELMNDYYT